MKVIFALLALLSLSSPTLYAEQVESIAGTIKSLIHNTQTESLTITGTINAADIDFINNHLPNLVTLDLSGATIEASADGAESNTLPAYALMGSRISTLTLPANLKTLADGCLAASSITSLIIPEGVDSIGIAVCNGCNSLVEVTVPSSALAVPRLAFKGCTALKSVTLPLGIVSIGAQSFYGCTALEKITIPETTTAIGDEAFNGCTRLSNVKFPSRLKSVGEAAFSSTGIAMADLSECKNMKFLGSWAFSHCLSLTEASLPESLTEVGEGIFFDCTSLETVALPSTLTELTPYMLKDASLTSADDILTDVTQSVGRYALYGNEQLTFIKLPASVGRIDDKAMARMGSLTQVDATGLKALPALGENVFDGTAGADVTLLASAAMAPEFEAAPQWREFNIVIDEASSADAPTIDAPTDKVMIRHADNTLYIKSERAIETVTLHDMQGRAIAREAIGGNSLATIPTSGMATGVVIVTIQFTDDSAYSIKVKI